VASHCPHLGLQGDRHQLCLVPTPRHRCYLPGEPERIAEAHQGRICLTSSYRRCPRLASPLLAAHTPRPHAPVTERQLPARYPNLRAMPRRAAARRPFTCVEMTVLGLVTSIVLAGCFVGYLVAHRTQVGPGMQAVVAVVTVSPGMPQASPSLVPTVPPTAPAPTVTATAQAVLPTLIPEPALPLTVTVETQFAPPPPIPEPVPSAVATAARLPADTPPTRLTIARIGLDISVLPVGTRIVQQGGGSKTVWADVPNAGAFHSTSAYPGTAGNTVINGHRDILGGVFRNLHRLKVGDEILVYVGQVPYSYIVSEILVVPETFASAEQQAENLRLIGPFLEERLTLITCTPVGLATHRLLVIARPPN
jgi:LPXTG-site transpeptidase (sortase) family protein